MTRYLSETATEYPKSADNERPADSVCVGDRFFATARTPAGTFASCAEADATAASRPKPSATNLKLHARNAFTSSLPSMSPWCGNRLRPGAGHSAPVPHNAARGRTGPRAARSFEPVAENAVDQEQVLGRVDRTFVAGARIGRTEDELAVEAVDR